MTVLGTFVYLVPNPNDADSDLIIQVNIGNVAFANLGWQSSSTAIDPFPCSPTWLSSRKLAAAAADRV